MKKHFIQYHIRCDRAVQDFFLGDLSPFVGAGIEIRDAEDIKDFLENHPSWEITDLTYEPDPNVEIILTREEDDASFQSQLEDLMAPYNKEGSKIEILAVETVEDRDWSAEWKKGYEPTPAGSFVIVPSWVDYDLQAGEVQIDMDPGMAFGTGTHETTVLCLEALSGCDLKGKRLLDVGSGTGILAIGAALVGASECLLVDIDPIAVEVSQENVDRNGVGAICKVREGDLLDHAEGKYDVITANILADVLITLIGSVSTALLPGGVFIGSGILLDQAHGVQKALEKHGFTEIERKDMGDWCAFKAVLGGGR